MSRPLRAGEASKPWACRITDAERFVWERASRVEGSTSLSAWAVKTLNAQAVKILGPRALEDAQALQKILGPRALEDAQALQKILGPRALEDAQALQKRLAPLIPLCARITKVLQTKSMRTSAVLRAAKIDDYRAGEDAIWELVKHGLVQIEADSTLRWVGAEKAQSPKGRSNKERSAKGRSNEGRSFKGRAFKAPKVKRKVRGH